MLDDGELKILKRAFPRADHEFVRGFVYLTEDAITNRIEEVDPSWTFDIQRMDRVDGQAVVCARLTIKDVSREGVGMQQINEKAGEADKGAATDALKRCARLFGIGRYLLDAPKEGDAFNAWLAGQQKQLGKGAPDAEPEPPPAKVTGAGIQKPQQPPVTYWTDDETKLTAFYRSALERFTMTQQTVDEVLERFEGLNLADWRASRSWALAALVADHSENNLERIDNVTAGMGSGDEAAAFELRQRARQIANLVQFEAV